MVTIGTQFLFRGLALVLVAGKSYALVQTKEAASYDLMVGRLFGIPMEFYWLVLAAIIVWLLLNRHRLGQNAYIIGDNKNAAALMGIPIRRTRILLFVLMGFAAAFAGLLNSLQVVNFYPCIGPRIPAADPGRGLRRRHLGVRRTRQHLWHVHRRVHDRRHHRRASWPSA